MQALTIVSAQLNFLVGDITGNIKRIVAATEHAKQKYNADLVVFPEMTVSSYPPEDLLLRPGFLNACQLGIMTLQKEIKETAIIIGYPHKVGNCVYNQAVLIQNGQICATYAKQELPNYTVFDEKRYFCPGNTPCVFKFKELFIGLTICEDLWLPGPCQRTVEAGAQLIITINASPFDRNKARMRESVLVERVQQTQVPFIYVNLVGGQDELVFDGGSMVVNANGQRCQQAPYFIENYMVTKINYAKDQPLTIAEQKLPPRLSIEENVYQALVLGVRDYIQKNHFPGAIIGLSGGIDSALTLCIAVDAIGAENVYTCMMPSRYTRSISKEDAQKQAELLGVSYQIIEIEAIFKAFLDSLTPTFSGKKLDTTEENLQARIRGSLLMALSNKTGNIVLTTGNKSEMSVGYATLYGDMAGGFAVIKDIPKTMVYQLAHYRNQISAVIPERVFTRPPSAELAPEQLDQDFLPPYSILDEILERYIELDQSREEIYATGIDRNIIDLVISLINRNEYKRRQAPIGIRTTQRAFGKDRRYPITSGYE